MRVRIATIIHEYDVLYTHRWFRRPQPMYLMADMLEVLRSRGWSIKIVRGTARRPPPADMAVMHTDVTFVTDDYLALGERYPVCVNGRVRDISKSAVSDARLSRTDDWHGPVIVKTELNAKGGPEVYKNARARKKGRELPFPDVDRRRHYEVFGSLGEVPAEIWSDRAMVVERFLPERLPDGFAMCHYVFCGDYEFCARYVAANPMVKAKDAFRYETMAVPAEIRRRRSELHFDFGKFDFTFHDGKALLLDANKTVGRIPPSGGASVDGLADGLLGLLARHG